MHERPFESIAIKQILARADVARSTFYAQFEGKEEMLVSAIEEAMGQRGSAQCGSCDVLRFALPMLEHIERLRSDEARPAAKMLRFHRRAHETLRQASREFVRRELCRTPSGSNDRSTALVSDHVASTFIVVLEWWLISAPELDAAEVYFRFEELSAPALRTIQNS